MSLRFFDATVRIGHRPSLARRAPMDCTVTGLLRDMDHFGVDQALVSHAAADYCAAFGNRLLMESLARHPRLFPCWVATPFVDREPGGAARWVASLEDHGVRAVRLNPFSDGMEKFALREILGGPLLNALEARGVPVLCKLDGELVDQLCGAHPGLTVINTIQTFGVRIAPVLRRHPRLHLEMSRLCHHNDLEWIAREVGADRLVFGTSWGDWISPGAALTLVSAAALPESDKARIAGGTLRALLRLPEPPVRAEPPRGDPFVDALRRGRPIRGEQVIDAHAHTFGPEMRSVLDRPDAAGQIDQMDRLGIRWACVAPNGSMCGAETEAANVLNAEAVAAFPDRLIGYTRVNPNRPETVLPLLRDQFDRYGIRHVKLHPTHNAYPVNGPRYEPAIAFAREHGGVVLAHSDDDPFSTPALFDSVAEKYPDVPFIIGHGGNGPPRHEATMDVMRRRPNVYADTSGWGLTWAGILETLVAELGSDRILFGTDCPALSVAHQIGAAVYARIPLEAKQRIMGLNAARLFRIPTGPA